MISYLAAIVAFLAALIALAGNTWDKESPGKVKLTWTGKVAASLALLGLVVSLSMAHASRKDAQQVSEQLERAAASADEAREEVQLLETQLRDYKSLLKLALDDSERQPQYVMAEYVSLRSGKAWRAPSALYAGSLVKFYGFSCTLLLAYGDTQEYIRPSNDSSVPEIAVTGGSGESMRWEVRSASGEPCHGKIYVVSTPRIRSVIRSWREEELDRRYQ